nr:MAG TPA: hypothetical protein [Caudoviricetes sp.]
MKILYGIKLILLCLCEINFFVHKLINEYNVCV